jgi:hypothetical protein
MPYFAPALMLLVPRCPQRKKLVAAKSVVHFAPPPPNPDLPIKTVIKFLNVPDMAVTTH